MWFIWLTVILLWVVMYMVVGIIIIAVVDIFIADGVIHEWLADAPSKWMAEVAMVLWPAILVKLAYNTYKNHKDEE